MMTLAETRNEHQFISFMDLQERRYRASLSPEQLREYDRFNNGEYANYPVGEQLPCYSCEPKAASTTTVFRVCCVNASCSDPLSITLTPRPPSTPAGRPNRGRRYVRRQLQRRPYPTPAICSHWIAASLRTI